MTLPKPTKIIKEYLTNYWKYSFKFCKEKIQIITVCFYHFLVGVIIRNKIYFTLYNEY